ncbi:MAG: anthranilate synthase component I family protein [Phycisphaerales bacterium]
MKPPFDIAADLDTPVSAFRKLQAAGFEPSFLLESVEGGARLARYSFLGLGRAVTLTLTGKTLTVNGESRPAPETRAGLLDAMRTALDDAPSLAPEDTGLPFTGGLVGATGYDTVRRFERVPTIAPAPEGALWASYVAPRSLLVFDHFTRRVALLHAGAEWERDSLRREIIHALRGAMPAAPVRTGHAPPTPSLSRDDFIDRVGVIKKHIVDGDVFQLVLSIRFEGEHRSDPFEVYRALRLLNPSSYMYYLDLPGAHDEPLRVVGSSPEALVKLNRGTAELRPIAGTRPRGRSDAHDRDLERELLADPKEAAEHVMLVDLARNDLGRVAQPGTITVDPYRVIERYSHVMHIVSGVTGALEAGRDQFDLFAAAFPAGTLVGAPKVRAMEIIESLEPVRRGLYGGTVGYFSKSGDMDQAICIRTLVFENGRYAYQAGAGVVADSDPGAEHDEVRAKVGALEAALALAEEGL